jgi:maltoporin
MGQETAVAPAAKPSQDVAPTPSAPPSAADSEKSPATSATDARVAELERRLAALEKETTPEVAPASPETEEETSAANAEEIQREIDRYVHRQFKNSTETRNRLTPGEKAINEKMEEVMNGFIDIGGYFRAGYGRNDRGGPQTDFQAPGALAKYRLGNEANNFGEIIFGKNIYVPGIFSSEPELRPSGVPTGPIARVQFRVDFFNPYSDSSMSADTSVGLPEAWASIGNVIPSQPTAKIWAGNRYYRRQDISIDDFFFWNMSGGGAGIEDIEIGRAKMAFAWIGVGSQSGVSDVPEPDALNEAGHSKTNLDLRLYDWDLLAGNVEVGIIYSHTKSGLDENGEQADSTSGVSFNFVHKIPHFISDDGQQRFTVQVGNGAAKTFNSTFERITTEEGVFIRPDDPASWRFRVMDDFTANLNEHFSLGPVLLYQVTDFADGSGRHQWFSAGVRPIVHFNRFFNIAVEAGVDWVKDPGLDAEGSLYKLTLAPQVSLGNRFLSRPAIRAFVTWAHWTPDFVGQVGGLDYVDRSYGFNAGAQMEAWF